MEVSFGRRARRPLRRVLPAIGVGLVLLVSPPASAQEAPAPQAPPDEAALLGQRAEAVDTAEVRDLVAASDSSSFVAVDVAALTRTLVGDMELLPEVDDPDSTNTACRGVVPQDAAIELLGETSTFRAVEASLCDHRIEGAPAPELPLGLEWHGQIRDDEGDVLATAVFSVLLDEGGRPDLATGYFQAQQTQLELWPADGTTYLLREPSPQPDAEEGHDDAPAPEATEPGEGPAAPGDEAPGAGGSDLGGGIDSDYDDPAPSDGSAADGLGNNGGQPRPGGRSGNRTLQVLVGYANGISSTTASTAMANRVAQTNSAFVTSGMPVRVEGLGPLSAGYTQHASSMGVDLAHIFNKTDSVMDGLNLWQEGGELDAIHVMVPNDTPSECGRGYLNPSVDGFTATYSVGAIDPGCTLTFAHELGHTFGAHHNPENADPGTVFPWSYGHYAYGLTRSIMSYYDVCGGCGRSAQFSDPDDDFVGYPGVASGLPYRDNDRSITDTSWAITEQGETDSNDFIWYRSASSHTSHTINATSGEDVEGPYTPLAGDFDGDGRSDQLYYFPGRPRERIWWYGTSAGAYSQTRADILGDYRPVVGDFDGDGRDDVFWYGPGPAGDTIWWGTAVRSDFGTMAHTGYPTVSGSNYRPVSGDFDGDGMDDLLWYGPGSVSDSFWWGNATRSSFGGTSTSITISNTFDAPFSGDFNGDGMDEIFLYQPGSGFDALWHGWAVRSQIGPLHQTSVSISGDYTPLSGDVDGDLDDDVFWYGSGSTADTIWSGQSTYAGFAGQAGTSQSVNGVFEATIGDFNGDGYADPYWFAFG
jgi:hypothetical protein